MIKFQTGKFHEFETGIRNVRETVFVTEQHVPLELEWDGLDETAFHAIAQTQQDAIIGTGRLLSDGHIGRMAVLAEWRGQGIGSHLLNSLLKQAYNQRLARVWLSAQIGAIAFYQRHGFTVISNEYLDAGILHKDMELLLAKVHPIDIR